MSRPRTSEDCSHLYDQTPAELVESVVPLCYRLARYACNGPLNLPELADDLAHELVIDLLASLQCGVWDPRRGALTNWVYQRFRNVLARTNRSPGFALNHLVRVPGRPLRGDKAEGQRQRERSRSVWSLDAGDPTGDQPGGTLAEETADPSCPDPAAVAERSDESRRLRDAVATLPARHRQIVALRYGLDGRGERTLDVIGSQCGVSKQRIGQIQDKSLHRLAVAMRED